MPLDITTWIDPTRTAVVLNECQQGVIGHSSTLPAVAAETRWILPNAGRLATAARRHGAAVMHTVASRRADGRGGLSGRVVSRHTDGGRSVAPPADYEEIMPEIGLAESDFVVRRLGGMGGLSASGAVSILRSLEISTLLLGGISLNAGVLSMMMYAIDAGFSPIVVEDASGGYPHKYGEDVLKNTVRWFAPITTVDTVLDIWATHYAVSRP
jgi:nicotinamidase-related amidase